ncbi:MAG: hypothetical protein J7621_09720 [Niastella sp.]|jgi:hypothetical protein|nr:hypothetical protein [Niastella sp.]
MMQNELITKRPMAEIGEEVGYQLGTEFISNYRNANPNETLSYVIGKNIIEKILAQPGCEGIHFYNAINEYGKKTLVYVGIDKDGKNIFEYTAVNNEGNITNEGGIVGDRTDGDGESWWKWIFGW